MNIRNQEAFVGRLTIPFLLLFLWWGLYLVIRAPAMASPLETFNEFLNNAGDWWPHIWVSTKIILLSIIIITVAGVAVGTLIGLNSTLFQIFNPIIMAVYSIPKITVYPIFLLIFGISDSGKIAFTVFHGIFPVIITCMEAVQLVPKTYLKIANAYELNFYKKIRYIIIPAIMPQIVSGLRLGFSLGILGLILIEMFASYEGIGNLLHHYMLLNSVSSILALFVIACFISLFFAVIFLVWQESIERKIGKLKPAAQKM